MAMARSLGGSGLNLEPDLPELVSQPMTSADCRLFDKVLKKLNKLSRLCSDPQLRLRVSPPYLPELVPETVKLLTDVWAPYRAPVPAVPRWDEGEYLRIHVQHLLDKTEKAVLLFKEGKEKIYEEKSSYRWDLSLFLECYIMTVCIFAFYLRTLYDCVLPFRRLLVRHLCNQIYIWD